MFKFNYKILDDENELSQFVHLRFQNTHFLIILLD